MLCLVLLLPQHSYSEYVFGYSNPVPVGSVSGWNPSDLVSLGTVEGVDLSAVIYRYTAVKDPADDFTVTIRNEYSNGSGYIFSETDDWSGVAGNTITKAVPFAYTPLSDFGQGELTTTGTGSVNDPFIVYTYRLDPSYVMPQVPEIDYTLPQIDIYDATDDDAVKIASEKTDESLYEGDTDEIASEEGDDSGESLEAALSAANAAISLANGISQEAMMRSMNQVSLSSYQNMTIDGGVYKETVVLKDKKIHDNRRAFRSLAQDRKFSEMIDRQYRR